MGVVASGDRKYCTAHDADGDANLSNGVHESLSEMMYKGDGHICSDFSLVIYSISMSKSLTIEDISKKRILHGMNGDAA